MSQLLPLAKLFLKKVIPPAVAAYITVEVESQIRELKAELAGEREKSKGGVITNAPARDLQHTPMRESTLPVPVVDPNLGRLQ